MVRGDIDVATSGQLHSALEAEIHATDGTMVLDCSELTFLDASGIHVLLDAQRTLDRAGRDCRIEHLADPYRRLLEILDLSDRFGLETPRTS
jgi:anti-sigma B factor antagonist